MKNDEEVSIVDKAKTGPNNENLEIKFNEAAIREDKVECEKIRNLFIKNLAELILDIDIGLKPDFILFCKELIKFETKAKEKTEKITSSDNKDLSEIENEFDEVFTFVKKITSQSINPKNLTPDDIEKWNQRFGEVLQYFQK